MSKLPGTAPSKPRLKIERWEILKWPFTHLTGILMQDHHTNPNLPTGRRVYTSMIEDYDPSSSEVETRNTIYELVGPEVVAGKGVSDA